MILLLLLSVILGIIFRKLPHVCLGISILPALYIAFMFEKELLCEQEALFLAAAFLHILGNITECILRDKEDGRHRLFIASKIPSAIGALLCFILAELILSLICVDKRTDKWVVNCVPSLNEQEKN